VSSRPKVLVTRRMPPGVERRLADRFEAVLNTDDLPLDSAALGEAMSRFDGILSTVTDDLSASAFAGQNLRAGIVANFGVGFNNIDLVAARRRGILVTNTPDVLTDDTADLALALMLATARRMGEGERLVRSGKWQGWSPTQLLGTRLTGKTLGLIGFGRIGRAVAHRAHHGFGMKILYHSRSQAQPSVAGPLGARFLPLADLLGASDFVSLHVPATESTSGLIDADMLGRMKRGAILINTARGDVLDEAALVDALRSGHLAGAGLDVYRNEPRIEPELAEFQNVVLLPHLGSATSETREAMGLRALQNLSDFFDGREPPDRVG